jgi:hypothetical protein
VEQPQQQLVMLNPGDLAGASGGQQVNIGGQVISIEQLQIPQLSAHVPIQLENVAIGQDGTPNLSVSRLI